MPITQEQIIYLAIAISLIVGLAFLIVHLTKKKPVPVPTKPIDDDKSMKPVSHIGFSVKDSDFPWCVATTYAYRYVVGGNMSMLSPPSDPVQSETDGTPILQIALAEGADVIVYRKVADTEFVEIAVDIDGIGVFVDRDNLCQSLPAPETPTFPSFGDHRHNQVSWQLPADTPGSIPWRYATRYAYSLFSVGSGYESPISQWTPVAQSDLFTNPILRAQTSNVFRRRWYRRVFANMVEVPADLELQWLLNSIITRKPIGGSPPLLEPGLQPITAVVSVFNQPASGGSVGHLLTMTETGLLRLSNTNTANIVMAIYHNNFWGVLGFDFPPPGSVQVIHPGQSILAVRPPAFVGPQTQSEHFIDEPATSEFFVDRWNPSNIITPPPKPMLLHWGKP